jgi:hypothetical protein
MVNMGYDAEVSYIIHLFYSQYLQKMPDAMKRHDSWPAGIS